MSQEQTTRGPGGGGGDDRVRVARDYQERMILAWSEGQLQQHVILLATALGWRHYHTHDSRRSPVGFPDLVMVHAAHGRLLFRELKAERGRYRAGQREWLEELAAAGADAGTWRPRDVVSGRVERELRSRA